MYSLKYPNSTLVINKKRRMFIYELAKELIAPHENEAIFKKL